MAIGVNGRLMQHALLGIMFVVLLVPQTGRADDNGKSRPNFLLLIADDMAWDDCGAYGHRTIRTPHLDRLAQQGMRCDRALLTCSSCSPSRASVLTGRYPHSTGAQQLHLPLPAHQVTVAELLRAAGYYTAAAGKWHLGAAAKAKLDAVQEGEEELVSTLRNRPREKPFFLWLAFHDPHRPYQKGAIAQPHDPADTIVPPYLPDVPETRQDLAMYYDEISRLDAKVGEIITELQAQQAIDDTLVIFISDNGRPFPRCKTTLYDSGLRTPCLVRYPALVKPGSISSSLISSIDIAPTLLELAGIPRGASFQGESLVPLLKDPQAQIRDYAFSEHNWHDFDDHGRSVRSARYKYIRNYYTDIPGTPPADAIRSITFAAMKKLRDANQLSEVQKTCFTRPRPSEELYDVQSDPHELNNLADDPDHGPTLAELRKALADWQNATEDRVPTARTPDKFDRESGEPLATRSRKQLKS